MEVNCCRLIFCHTEVKPDLRLLGTTWLKCPDDFYCTSFLEFRFVVLLQVVRPINGSRACLGLSQPPNGPLIFPGVSLYVCVCVGWMESRQSGCVLVSVSWDHHCAVVRQRGTGRSLRMRLRLEMRILNLLVRAGCSCDLSRGKVQKVNTAISSLAARVHYLRSTFDSAFWQQRGSFWGLLDIRFNNNTILEQV